MINFPESLPFLGLASNNCTYTTSHTRKKDLLQIFFRRPSFNNNFCFIYFPLTYHTSSGFLDVHRSECMWFCFCFNLSPSCSSVFIFSPSLLVTVKVYVCFFLFCLYSPFCPFCFVWCCLCCSSIFFISQQSFRSLLLTFLPISSSSSRLYSLWYLEWYTKRKRKKQSKLAPSVCLCFSTFASLCVKLRASTVSVSMLFGFPIV